MWQTKEDKTSDKNLQKSFKNVTKTQEKKSVSGSDYKKWQKHDKKKCKKNLDKKSIKECNKKSDYKSGKRNNKK